MSNSEAEPNLYNNNSDDQNYIPNHEDYTKRQIQASFPPPSNIQLHQTMIPPVQQQQFLDQFQALQLAQHAQYYNPTQIIPPLPLVNMPMVPAHYAELQQGVIYPDFIPANAQYHPHAPSVPLTMINPQSSLKVTMRSDAPVFSPLSTTTNSNQPKIDVNESTPVTDNPENNDKEAAAPFIFDLKKYKYDYFISNPSCSFDREHGKFGAPTGICTLNDDRLLVANFDRDSLLLIDINGVVHHIYKDLPTPKDVLYYSSSPSQAVVATRKEVVILDLTTSKVVVRSKAKGFYPWNIQYLKEKETFAACDPSGERIVFLDKNLAEIGAWSFSDPTQEHLRLTQPNAYQKTYPYAAYILSDETSFILTHRQEKCQLLDYNTATATSQGARNTPVSLYSLSIYADSAKKCLLADKVNHCLVSIDKDSKIEEYRCKSIHEPYSITFLSTGTLCVTDWNKAHGTNGGVAIISEVELQSKK